MLPVPTNFFIVTGPTSESLPTGPPVSLPAALSTLSHAGPSTLSRRGRGRGRGRARAHSSLPVGPSTSLSSSPPRLTLQSLNNRISGLENQISGLENQITGLYRLILLNTSPM